LALDFAFAIAMMPCGIAFALCFAAGATLDRRGNAWASRGFFGLGIVFLAIGAASILWNLAGWAIRPLWSAVFG
jgi:hypothetical protein